MPSSAIESVPYFIEFVRKNNPDLKSILDVGMGFGKDGFLLREYFDVKTYHAYQPKDWKLDITGIDIYNGYISNLQKILYNKIVIADIFDVLPELPKYDLAVLADVIEHFPKEKGIKLLDKLFEHTEDIIITTPNGFHEHRGKKENLHEEHLSGWTKDDFKKYNLADCAVIKRIRSDDELLVVYLRK